MTSAWRRRRSYGDKSVWDAVNIFEFKDGKVVRQTDYFCQPLPAPAWRAQWVERMEGAKT
jgi:hypothetical protein